MDSSRSSVSLQDRIEKRADAIREQNNRANAARTDRFFALLFILQWIAGVNMAAWFSPRAWEGLDSSIHPHIWGAIFVGGIIAALPIALVLKQPGAASTRYVVACAQMLFSALLIHLSGVRIETHFHIFGSLAFLSFYREWRVLVPATLIVALDHALRGMFWPQSVFGVTEPDAWRWVEHAGWVAFEDVFLMWACIRGAREMTMLATRQAELEATNERVEAEVALQTARVESVTQELVNTARKAGMAEIATGVLHNVGNVLNSVNVSANIALRIVRESEIGTFIKAGELLKCNRSDLPNYLTTDERGKLLPDFLIDLAGCIGREQGTLSSELHRLETGIDHIKQIVCAQQQHASNGTLRQRMAPAEVFEQAVSMHTAASSDGEVLVIRQFEEVAPIPLDVHKVLQILLNLLQNARRAVLQADRTDRQMTLSIRTVQHVVNAWLEFAVSDNGIGIEPRNLQRIFSHGFTTHADGHGFGLHSAANAAREMGGALSVASEGADRGATFTLRLPMTVLAEAERLLLRDETASVRARRAPVGTQINP